MTAAPTELDQARARIAELEKENEALKYRAWTWEQGCLQVRREIKALKETRAIAAPHGHTDETAINPAYERDRSTRMMARQSGENLPNIYMQPDLEMEAAHRARAALSGQGQKS